MDKVIRDGMVAVLYSPAFGAGWYSWNTEVPECLFDPEIVAAVERSDRAEAQQIAERKWPNQYWGGARDLKIAWIPEGTQFEVDEYDGNESIRFGLYKPVVA